MFGRRRPVPFTIGQLVAMPCSVEPVSIPGERLVTLDLPGERMSGFVRSDFVDAATVRAIVVSVSGSSVTVTLPGSFFVRETSRASVPSGWAAIHLRGFPTRAIRRR
jgi:hypothetical protein